MQANYSGDTSMNCGSWDVESHRSSRKPSKSSRQNSISFWKQGKQAGKNHQVISSQGGEHHIKEESKVKSWHQKWSLYGIWESIDRTDWHS